MASLSELTPIARPTNTDLRSTMGSDTKKGGGGGGGGGGGWLASRCLLSAEIDPCWVEEGEVDVGTWEGGMPAGISNSFSIRSYKQRLPGIAATIVSNTS